MESSLFLPAAGVVAVYLVYRALRFFLRRSPLSSVPGPPRSSNIILGHHGQLRKDPDEALSEQWLNEYGHVVSYRGMFGVSPCRLAHWLS
jgi:hypothetical protein